MKKDEKQLPPKVNTDNLKNHFRVTYKLADEQIEAMLESLANSLAKSLSALQINLDENDTDQIFRLAHSIKGMFLNMGEKQWAELARELELAASEDKVCDYRSMVEKIQYGVEDIL